MTDFTPPEAPAHEASALPVMLPGKLIGRDMALAKIYTQLKDNMPILVHGAAGVGKTALVGTLASAYTDLPGGVLWLHADNPTLPELIVRVGRAYNVREIAASDSPLAMIGAAANTLRYHKPLLVLDGKLDAEVTAEFIRRCADKLPLLMTSEEQLVGPWASVLLEALEPEQASLMFKHIAGLDGPDGEENDADVEALIQALGYLPFGIAVAAGAIRASKQTPAEFRAQMPQQPGVPGSLLALTAAFKSLSAALQGLALMVGATFRGEASAEVLSMVSGAPQDSIQGAMQLLAQRHLVERFHLAGTPCYRLHPITHTFTQPLLRGSGKLDSLRDKFHEAILSYARTHSAASPPDYDKLAAEMDNMLAVARAAADKGDRDTANQLALALAQAGDFVSARGYVSELLALRGLAVSSTSAFPAYTPAPPAAPVERADEEAEDIEETAALEDEAELEDEYEDEEAAEDDDDLMPYVLGEEDEEFEEEEEAALPPFESASQRPPSAEDYELELDETEEEEAPEAEAAEPEPPAQEPEEVARLRVSLVQARQQLNKHRQAEILSQIGQAQIRAGLPVEAISSFSEALAVYEDLEDRGGILNTLETLAALANRTDNAPAAVLHATRGAQLAGELGNPSRQMRLLALLGDARQQLGESDQAIAAYMQALGLAQAADERDYEATLRLRLGYAQLDDNLPMEAVKTWDAALALYRETGRRDAEGRVLGALGTAHGEMGLWTDALAYHKSALDIAREVGDKEEEMLQLNNLAYAAVKANQLGEAVLRYRQALHLAYESDNRDNIVSTIVDLARLLVESPRHVPIAELLVNDAARLDPNDRDVRRLKERIEDEVEAAKENGAPMTPVQGSAQQYAENAYRLLEG